jgi:hypothetical protein
MQVKQELKTTSIGAKRKRQIRTSNTIMVLSVVIALIIGIAIFVVVRGIMPAMQTQKLLDGFVEELRDTVVAHERVGIEAAGVILKFHEEYELYPDINWSAIGEIDHNFTVDATLTVKTFFGETLLKSSAEGKLGVQYLPGDYSI